MLPQEASFLTTLVVIPSVMYVLYRTVLPYERVMPDLKIGGALLFPLVAGAGVGFAHILLDPPLLFLIWGLLSFLFLYPLIETYAVLIIFNRRATLSHPAAPVLFGIGGAGFAMGLASAETFRSLAALGDGSADVWLILQLLALSTAFVLFHCSKGVYLGTHVAVGDRRRGILFASLLEGPLGLLYFAERVGEDDAAVTVALLLYAALVYVWVWHRFFPERMPEELDKAMRKEERRARIRRARKERDA